MRTHGEGLIDVKKNMVWHCITRVTRENGDDKKLAQLQNKKMTKILHNDIKDGNKNDDD